MRKLLLAAAAALMTIGAYAQYRPSIIVSAGYQGANLKSSSSGYKSNIASGARVGIDADFNLYEGNNMYFSLRPGAHFSMKGAKDQSGVDLGSLFNSKWTYTTHLYYIDFPILANVGFDAGEFGVFLNAGPYLGVGVGSSRKTTSQTNVIGNQGDKKVDSKTTNLFEGDNAAFGRFDWGIQLGAGVEYNRFLVGVGTQFGIQNINKTKEIAGKTLPTNKNATFFVTVGYRF